MRKFLFLLFAILPLFCFSQKARIQFKQTSHNFGTIGEYDGQVSHEFLFTNTGKAPLILTQVRAGCGCTTPEWSRHPILPGETGKIKVSFNPRHRKGSFVNSVTVNSNALPPVVSLTVRGKIKSQAADPYAGYPYSAGNLKMRRKEVNFGTITHTDQVRKTIEIVNTGQQPLSLSVLSDSKHLTASVLPNVLQKGEKGEIHITYDAGLKNDWGFVSDTIRLKTDEPADQSFHIVANITEDFSAYKADNYASAPRAVFSEKEGILGKLTKNSTKKHDFYIQNAGKSDLIIRKIKTSDDRNLTVHPSKMTVKPGKKIKVNLVLKTDDRPGKKIKIISFTLNDPKNTIVTYKLSGNIQ